MGKLRMARKLTKVETIEAGVTGSASLLSHFQTGGRRHAS